MQPNPLAWCVRSSCEDMIRVRWHDYSASFANRDASMLGHLVSHCALQAKYQFDVRMPMRVVGDSLWSHPLRYAYEPAQSKVFWIDSVADVQVSIIFHGPYYTSFRVSDVIKLSAV